MLFGDAGGRISFLQNRGRLRLKIHKPSSYSPPSPSQGCYVSRTCLVQGGSPIHSKDAGFAPIGAPRRTLVKKQCLFIGAMGEPAWHTECPGPGAGKCALTRIGVRILLSWCEQKETGACEQKENSAVGLLPGKCVWILWWVLQRRIGLCGDATRAPSEV